MRVNLDLLNEGNLRETIIFQLAGCDKIEDFSREELGQKADIILKVIEERIDENITEPYCKARFKELLK